MRSTPFRIPRIDVQVDDICLISSTLEGSTKITPYHRNVREGSDGAFLESEVFDFDTIPGEVLLCGLFGGRGPSTLDDDFGGDAFERGWVW